MATPPTGVVFLIPALRWELHQFAKKNKLSCPDLQWETAASNLVFLVGKYYFCAKFGDSYTEVYGPIAIHRKEALLFTKRGLERQ
jgi:hypothetical protein